MKWMALYEPYVKCETHIITWTDIISYIKIQKKTTTKINKQIQTKQATKLKQKTYGSKPTWSRL